MAFKLASVPPPHSLHPSTLTSGRHGYAVTIDGGHAVLYYCPQHRAAAIFDLAAGFWTIRTPLQFGAFLRMLAEAGITIPDDADSREWIEACGLAPVAGSGKH